MTLGEKIRALRKQAGWTQTELGQRLGVQKNAVSKWECGRVEDVPAGKIKALAALFGVPASQLIDDDGPRAATDDEVKFALFGGADGITDEMYEEVRRYAAYVRSRAAQQKKE